MGLGFSSWSAFSFLSPLALWGCLALPLLWWLLRLQPPSPKRQVFPALLLLQGLVPMSQSPARTPWWLLLLRLLVLLLLFVGLARPVVTPATPLPGSGVLTLIIDNGWSSGAVWPSWQAAFSALCQQAEQEQRVVLIVPTAPEAATGKLASIGPMPALTACPLLAQLQPQAWPTDHAAAQAMITQALPAPAAPASFWFSDGVRGTATETLYQFLQTRGALTLYQTERPHYLLQPPLTPSAALAASVTRADPDAAASILLTAEDQSGHTLGMVSGQFKAREKTITLSFDVPTTLRNQATRLVLQGQRDAGAVLLLDSRNARLPVGLIGDEVTQREQPLLNGLHYLERALSAQHEPMLGTAATLLTRRLPIIINTNETPLDAETNTALAAWVEQGGVLLQFAGAALAPDSNLLPTPLRAAHRTTGGTLSWDKPQNLQPFPPQSPFAGLPVPDDVSVTQQVLADPAGLTGDTSWALLQDGTPLVTGAKRGKGLSVLFHVPATPGWSSLPLSGLFVHMLERLVLLRRNGEAGTQPTSTSTLPVNRVLDGFGQLQPAPATALALSPAEQAAWQPTPAHPPGYYGQAQAARAFNLGQALSTLLPFAPPERQPPTHNAGQQEWRPWLLSAALLLLLADYILALALRGYLARYARLVGRVSMVGLMVGLMLSTACLAETAAAEPANTMTLSEKIWLGHITNGAGERSASAATGLQALAERVQQKTAAEKIGVVPVNLMQDDLSLIALLYWPLTEPPMLSADARQKLQTYLAHGGMLLLDLTSEPEHNLTLREADIALPALAPVTPQHPLFRTFYLLQECPGQNLDGTFWSERDVSGRPDNVPTVFIGARDWARAWALADNSGERQTELAMRCGLNLVMYALTGNYKMDQVHVGAILERLHQ
jgi:hypothetical protein